MARFPIAPRMLLCFGDRILIRGEERRNEDRCAVGKITRTAAGGAVTLTILWQQFRFQLCTTLLFSSPPLSFSLPPHSCMNNVKSNLFNHLFSSNVIVAFLSPSPSYIASFCHLPKPQHKLEVGLQLVSEGQV